MAATKEYVPPVKEKTQHEGRLTVMIMRSVGKVHSFKISPRILFGATIFFLLYFTVSVIIINNYLDLRQVNVNHLQEIKQLEQAVSKNKNTLHRSKQHIALMEDYIYNLEKQQERKIEPAKKEVLPEITVKDEVKDETEHVIQGMEQEEKSIKKVVDIENMVIKKKPSRITVNFKLVNLQSGENAVGGYIHIIARDKNSNSLDEWTYPREKLKKGAPANFRRGMLFLIQRFKPIYGSINLVPGSDSPTTIMVMIYDQSGKLILKKEFEVSNAS